ncbi:hypothetical protein P3C22_26845, partial [Pseudomonas sp. ER28]
MAGIEVKVHDLGRVPSQEAITLANHTQLRVQFAQSLDCALEQLLQRLPGAHITTADAEADRLAFM